ncbi:MAG: SUMF1/EgtB/PvdO family nonheme iron enzyme, partial [Planctomycetota bacterium]|nr:SUMF1/EgtB/PvdO family nonheme iron enzyme [Planctomycetota bacterium]
LAGCAQTSFKSHRSPSSLGAFEDGFTQPLEGTALDIEMVHIPIEKDEQGTSVGGFWVSQTEITWEFYDVFIYRMDGSETTSKKDVDAISRPSKPYIAMDRGFGHAGYPAISVSFHGATEFCKWLSLKTGRDYRLPTEQEWKALCARSGINTINATDHAWYKGNAKYKSHEVGSKKADALGLHDLWGNAQEWCVTQDNDEGVTLGGSYKNTLQHIGCGARAEPTSVWNASDPQFPKSVWWLADGGFIGFRVICDKK